MITAQGGDASYLCLERIDLLCKTKELVPVYAKTEGYLYAIDTERVGTAAQMLGAGRATKADAIDPMVGLVMQKRVGAYIRTDEPLCMIYSNDPVKTAAATEMFLSAMTIAKEPPAQRSMVYDIIGDMH